jgi:type I restriction enzyme S subunit
MSEKLPDGWKKVKLGEVAEIKMGQSPKSEFYNMEGKGLPFLQGNKTFGYRYPQIDMYCSNPIKVANKGEILFSVRAPVGDINIANQDICIGRGLASLKLKNNQNLFLYYLLHYTREEILHSESGTVFGSISKKDLENLEILIPEDKNEQKAISGILSSLDDKIDLLHRQNKTLEEMAQTLFRKWFIEDAKEDWEEKPLSFFGDIVCGKTPSKKIKEYFNGEIPFIKIPDMHGNTFILQTSDSLTEEGKNSQKNKTLPPKSICVSCIATVGLVSMTVKESQTNQQINSIVPKKDFYRYYLFLFMKDIKDLLIAMASGGTTTLNLNTKDFSNIKIPLPEENILKTFHSIVEPIFDKILYNQFQIRTLEQLRDTLLPKLMSGEVMVKL